MIDFRRGTSSFRWIYWAVSHALRQRLRTPPPNISANERQWFRWLMRGFKHEYWAWRHKHAVQAYLDNCHTGGPRLFGLIADAYLHIAYDLPRVIADSLDVFGPGLQKSPPRARSRALYLLVAPVFLKTFKKRGQSCEIGGCYGWLSKWLPSGWQDVFGGWVQGLRNAAWIHAEMLYDAGPVHRPALEHQLLNAVYQATQTIGRPSKWFLLWWASSPQFCLAITFAVPLAPFLGLEVTEWLTIAGVLLILLFFYLAYVLLAVRAYADYLGEAVYTNSVRAMAGDEFRAPESRRSPSQ